MDKEDEEYQQTARPPLPIPDAVRYTLGSSPPVPIPFSNNDNFLAADPRLYDPGTSSPSPSFIENNFKSTSSNFTTSPSKHAITSSSPPSFFRKQPFGHKHTKSSSAPAKNNPQIKKTQSISVLYRSLDPRELLTSVNSHVKNRAGSVLTRQTILKNDHFETRLNEQLDFYLQGAPNFRVCDFSIYGVAQPTIPGISTILALVKCHPLSPNTPDAPRCVWFSAREEPIVYINRKPFVLRDESTPLSNRTSYQGISADRLERMEERLKDDVAKEAERCGGLVLVHDESDGRVVPTWTCADNLQTPREVFDELKSQGYRVEYYRMPISPEQAPEDRYLDDYIEVIRNIKSTDPLVFNCGVGVGRTTFSIVAATLIRRAKILDETKIDPIPVGKEALTGSLGDLWHLDDSAEMQNRAILRLVYLLEKGLSSKVQPGSAIHWALARGPLIEDLKNAVMGNYHVISQLASVLMNGTRCKKLLDEIINRCDVMINLREVILTQRVSYSHTGDFKQLEKARLSLERYFFLLSFAAYVAENYTTENPLKFSDWFSSRPEITRMLHNLRRKGARLYLFRPVEDLSVLAENGLPMSAKYGTGSEKKHLANELEKYVIKMRQGTVLVQHTILKVDHWMTASVQGEERQIIEGAPNFRKTPQLNVYGVAQPTIQGMKNVIDKLLTAQLTTAGTSPSNIVWINLREEPLIYINGIPHVLRDQYFTLRNITSYSGITSSRLEQIESKLKIDVCNEITTYENKILIHGESTDGEIVPQWEECRGENVLTIREVVEDVLKKESIAEELVLEDGDIGVNTIEYFRVPVTAETPPDETDFDHLLSIVTRKNVKDASFILNCQVGMGRSTTGTVIVGLILHWLNGTRPLAPGHPKERLNYQLIHSLLRVIRNGLECKEIVDNIIDQCAQLVNLRDAIEDCRIQAEQAPVETPAFSVGKRHSVYEQPPKPSGHGEL